MCYLRQRNAMQRPMTEEQYYELKFSREYGLACSMLFISIFVCICMIIYEMLKQKGLIIKDYSSYFIPVIYLFMLGRVIKLDILVSLQYIFEIQNYQVMTNIQNLEVMHQLTMIEIMYQVYYLCFLILLLLCITFTYNVYHHF